jgi:hypothetical protein
VKTVDILNLWDSFNRVFEDSTLTTEEKAAIGDEILRQLPHADLIVTSSATLRAVTRSIRDRIGPKEPVSERRIAEDTRKIDSPGKETQKTRQPLRKAPANP